MPTPLRLTITLTLTLLPLPALAENWPRFRGPTGQGLSSETNLPTRWSPAENIAWKTEIPGQAWSSPIVWDNRVFLTTATDEGAACHVLCLDADSGKILWDKEVFRQSPGRKENRNSYATPTPVTDGRHVYAVFAGGSIACLDFSGNVTWTNHDVDFYSKHGLGASPILYNDLLIMPFDGSARTGELKIGWLIPWDGAFILALDKSTGKQKWKATRGLSRQAHVTPQVVDLDGHPQLISAAGDVVQGHNPTTGDQLWTFHSTGEGVVPSLVTADLPNIGKVAFTASGFIPSPDRTHIRAIRLDPNAKGDITPTHLLWEYDQDITHIPSFLYAHNLLFTVSESGIAQCLDAKTGHQLWRNRLPGTYAASPVAANGKIYFLNTNGDTTIIGVSPTFNVLARNSLEEHCESSPAPSNNRIFIRGQSHLFCISDQARN